MTGVVLLALIENDWASWFARRYLDEGYVVLRAATEAECWMRIHRYFPDAVILSDQLIAGDSVTFLNELRMLEPSIGEACSVIGHLPAELLALKYDLHPDNCLQIGTHLYETN
jgi:hypothetical protein